MSGLKVLPERIRSEHPLIHCITNYVTVNDCANILLACGASPIMADDGGEVQQITSICSSLVLNIGTLTGQIVGSMLTAGAAAKEAGHPVIFDPVGAGASSMRTSASHLILGKIRPEIVRCNISEIKMLMDTGSVSRGVDAAEIDQVTDANIGTVIESLKSFSAEHNCVTAVSGTIDVIVSANGRACAVKNGHPMMTRVTGSGCMLTALTAAYASLKNVDPFDAACAAFCTMGVCGEIAYSRMQDGDANATFRNRMIDAVCLLDGDTLQRMARYEML